MFFSHRTDKSILYLFCVACSTVIGFTDVGYVNGASHRLRGTPRNSPRTGRQLTYIPVSSQVEVPPGGQVAVEMRGREGPQLLCALGGHGRVGSVGPRRRLGGARDLPRPSDGVGE